MITNRLMEVKRMKRGLSMPELLDRNAQAAKIATMCALGETAHHALVATLGDNVPKSLLDLLKSPLGQILVGAGASLAADAYDMPDARRVAASLCTVGFQAMFTKGGKELKEKLDAAFGTSQNNKAVGSGTPVSVDPGVKAPVTRNNSATSSAVTQDVTPPTDDTPPDDGENQDANGNVYLPKNPKELNLNSKKNKAFCACCKNWRKIASYKPWNSAENSGAHPEFDGVLICVECANSFRSEVKKVEAKIAKAQLDKAEADAKIKRAKELESEFNKITSTLSEVKKALQANLDGLENSGMDEDLKKAASSAAHKKFDAKIAELEARVKAIRAELGTPATAAKEGVSAAAVLG